MGVYNVIDTKTLCPKCHKPVEWQSKHLIYDGFVLANLLENIVLNERMEGEMHTFCDKCKTGFDADIINGQITNIEYRKPIKKLKY